VKEEVKKKPEVKLESADEFDSNDDIEELLP